MKELFRRFRILLLAVVLVLLGLQLLGGRLDEQSELRVVDRAILAVYRPVNHALDWPFSKLAGLWSRYLALVEVKQKNQRLLEVNAELRMHIDQLVEQGKADERCREQLGFLRSYQGELLPAEVIARSVVGEHRTIILDRGTDHGVEPGLAVLTPEGLAGFVTQAAASVCVVTLIVDQRSAVDAIDQRSRARGLIQGISSDLCQFAFLEQSLDVALGDRVVSSGFGPRTVVPKGLLVGVVVRVEKAPDGLTQLVQVQPAVDFSSLEEALIQLPPQQVIDLREIPQIDGELYRPRAGLVLPPTADTPQDEQSAGPALPAQGTGGVP
ncbi:MAG: rod shape-determining protein MreC [Candidatus Alcyoniella australis]|nr:rod shape-determining protein MreC [Candidatus Alcyoniella australis]